MYRTQRLATTLILSLMIVSNIGCGQESDMPELGTVTGVVTLDGKPLADARIIFSRQMGQLQLGLPMARGNMS